MASEIAEGPEAVVATLAGCQPIHGPFADELASRHRIVLVATGASLAMSHAAAPAWRRHLPKKVELVVRQSTEAALGGIDGWSFEPTDLAVAVSQSGTSPETLAAARDARAAGAAVAAVTAHQESPLAEVATIPVSLACGEESDASTKSALSTLAALLALAGALPRGNEEAWRLGERLREVVRDDAAIAPAARILTGARRTWFLGFGTDLGIAEAAQLLWHEKVIRSATAATPSEFRHGLVEAFGPEDAVVLIDVDRPDARRSAYLDRVREEVSALGGTLNDVISSPTGATAQGSRTVIAIDAPDAGSAALEAMLRVQQLAHATALLAGTYRDGFAVLRRTVLPAKDLFRADPQG
jgi:fructoselysine-6-P-deglycase FrlB-like protein